MGEVIVITSGKGGVGKTTTTANLGTAFALKGKKVVVVDLDIGLRNLDLVLGLENRIVYDLVDVIKNTCKISQGLIKDRRFKGLYLLPSSQVHNKNIISPDEMKNLCLKLKEEFDFVLIDSPAGIEQGFKNAIAGADKAIIIATPEVSSIRDADRVIGLIETEEISDIKLIINRYDKELVDNGDMLNIDDVVDILQIDLIGVIPKDENIIISTNKGEPVVVNDKLLISKIYNNIADRLLGKEVPFVDLNVKKETVIEKIKSILKLKK